MSHLLAGFVVLMCIYIWRKIILKICFNIVLTVFKSSNKVIFTGSTYFNSASESRVNALYFVIIFFFGDSQNFRDTVNKCQRYGF